MTAPRDRTHGGSTSYDLLSRSSFGCPRTPILCGHMLSDHLGQGIDEHGDPVNPACTVPGCDCDGVS